MTLYDWEAFICHSSEDKEAVARPLAQRLEKLGLKIWLDETEIHLGDSLRAKIDVGLSRSRFGIVVLSPSFFFKTWTKAELEGLVARETDGVKVILPIWHNLTYEDVRKHSPILAGRLAISTQEGLDAIAKKIHLAILQDKKPFPSTTDIELARAFITAGKQPPQNLANSIRKLSFDDGKYKFDNLDGIGSLTELEDLDLFEIRLSNIEGISKLTNLRRLYLEGAEIQDFSPLEKLLKLEHLTITGSIDLTAIANLRQLKYLDLSTIPLPNPLPLQEYGNLEVLKLFRCQLRSFNYHGLNKLRILDLSSNPIKNIKSIANLPHLQGISLWRTNVSNLKPLSNLTDLRVIDIDYTPVRTVAALAELENLRFLDAANTEIKDFHQLRHLTNLYISQTNTHYRDELRVEISEDWQIWHWCRVLGVSEENLKRLVSSAGPSLAAIRSELDKRFSP